MLHLMAESFYSLLLYERIMLQELLLLEALLLESQAILFRGNAQSTILYLQTPHSPQHLLFVLYSSNVLLHVVYTLQRAFLGYLYTYFYVHFHIE